MNNEYDQYGLTFDKDTTELINKLAHRFEMSHYEVVIAAINAYDHLMNHTDAGDALYDAEQRFIRENT